MSNVEQNFKIGDKVVWSDKEYAGQFHKETVDLVMSITGIDYIDEARAYLILLDNKVEAFDYRFELYKEKEMKENKFNIGDCVRIVANDSSHDFSIGEICKIVRINPSNYDVSNSKGGNWYVLAEDMELVQSKPSFDLHKNPWYIRVGNEEQFNLANEWLEENFGQGVGIPYSTGMKYLTNTNTYSVYSKVLYGSTNFDTSKEIKLTYKTTISSVEFPVVEIETEQQKRIRELKATIDNASKQLEELMKETK